MQIESWIAKKIKIDVWRVEKIIWYAPWIEIYPGWGIPQSQEWLLRPSKGQIKKFRRQNSRDQGPSPIIWNKTKTIKRKSTISNQII